MDFQEFVGGRIDFWERRRIKEKMTVRDLIEASYFGLIQNADNFWKSEFERVKADRESEKSFESFAKANLPQDDTISEDLESQFSKSPLNYNVEKIEKYRACEFCYRVKSWQENFWLEIQWNPLIEVCHAKDGILIEICIDERDAQKDMNRAGIGFVKYDDAKYLVKFCDHVFGKFDEILERVPLG